jgi:hypothetical protein
VLANAGVAGPVPVIEWMRDPAGATEKRFLEGLYLDAPEDFDDPYRFFRW